MTIRQLILGLAVLIVMTGCKTSFQSKWKNFNAYYNTYYNAKKSYNTGLKKNLDQNREYNPLQPIRIHPKPVNSGAQDFDKAIQKGADVLRRYDDTKWVDNAIGLIGKSYYYRQEYFSADQKFKELFVTTENKDLRQKSILWQGRVLLDMELHNEGIAFLSEQLTLLEGEWIERPHHTARGLYHTLVGKPSVSQITEQTLQTLRQMN
jgi:tetratricopeptide (TPR) repeat protein